MPSFLDPIAGFGVETGGQDVLGQVRNHDFRQPRKLCEVDGTRNERLSLINGHGRHFARHYQGIVIWGIGGEQLQREA